MAAEQPAARCWLCRRGIVGKWDYIGVPLVLLAFLLYRVLS